MRAARALAALCALRAHGAASPAGADAAAAEAENRRLREGIEATERDLSELVRLAGEWSIPLDVREVRGGAGAPWAPRRAREAEAGGGAVARRGAVAAHEGEPEAEGGEGGAEEAAQDHGEGGGDEASSAHGHAGEGEEGDEALEEETEVICDLDTSIMLLGMISFVMVLFYLTNWPDDDIRLYSWQITSTTISIFCSVMLFQGFNKFLVKRVVHPLVTPAPWIMTLFQFLQCFVYLACIHFGTGIASGVLCRSCWFNVGIEENIHKQIWVYTDALRSNNNSPVAQGDIQCIRAVKRARGKETTETSSVWVSKGEEIPVQKKLHTWLQRKRQTKALGMLFAHLAGFAAIYSGKALQTLVIPEDLQGCNASLTTKLMGMIPVIVNQVVLRLAFMVSNVLRDYQLRATEAESGSAADRAGLEKMRELMKEEVEESENDVSSLSMSFLIVNNMVFFITGYLPTEESEQRVCSHGREAHVDLEHGAAPVMWLYFMGFLMVGFAVAQAVCMAKFHHALQNHRLLIRVLDAMLNATGMCFAWCLIWATKWLAKMYSELDQHRDMSGSLFSHEILGRVLLAFTLTAFAAVSVFGVDKVADAMRTNYRSDRDMLLFLEEITRVIVNSLGILVGFSWEHSFDGSVEDVASTTSASLPVPEFQLGLGMAVCILILPAWRDYILEKVMLIEVMLKKKRGLAGGSDEH
ncbi:unnamed protein product [Prorocentrum cordatum]|uniref:Uncharacterized protein n=1 Tax=Prorocentrum cordatum TaxID=2364126 RepID=A0ABN9W4C2_9DINO|nr:unnamed protein product [Polarella glacialis]